MAVLTKTKTERGSQRYANLNGEIGLAVHQVYPVDLLRGELSIRVIYGSIWLTVSNDPQDYLLQAGERLVIRKRGRVLLEGLSAAGVRVE